MPRHAKRAIHALLIVLAVATAACSNDDGDGQTATTGGARASGGASGGAGGARATGGTTSTGGASGAGGERQTGGTTGTGGNSATGGTPSSGGARTGGTTSSGGTVAAGGSTSAGGAQTGGTTGSGGARTGGTTGTGGGGTGGAGGIGTGGGGIGTGGLGGSGTGGTRADGGVDGPADGGTDGGTAYNPCPAGAACAILPIGDSITEGCCTQPMGGYRIELFRQATKNGKNLTFVGLLSNGPSTVDGKTFPKKHEGHGGYTIAQIAGLADNSIASSRPNIVILKIGTNDINGNMDLANAPKRLEGLIDQIIKDAPDALLVVSAIIPTKTDGTNQRVQAYNGAIPALVDARAKAGKHVVFVDNYKAYTQNTNYKTAYMADNLHPNDAGYAVLGQSFYDVIASFLTAAP